MSVSSNSSFRYGHIHFGMAQGPTLSCDYGAMGRVSAIVTKRSAADDGVVMQNDFEFGAAR